MDMQAGLDELPDYPYVSTGHLPPADEIVGLVDGAYQRYKTNTDGKNSQIYPALAEVPSDLFGICVVGTNGEVHSVGDSDHEFSIMSVSKPFIFALVCEAIGAEAARGKLGANATGLPFNSLAAVDRLQTALAGTTATPAQVAEAVRVNNTDSRLRALKIGLLIMAGVAMLAIIPAGGLPGYVPGEMPNAGSGRRKGGWYLLFLVERCACASIGGSERSMRCGARYCQKYETRQFHS